MPVGRYAARAARSLGQLGRYAARAKKKNIRYSFIRLEGGIGMIRWDTVVAYALTLATIIAIVCLCGQCRLDKFG